MQLEDYFDFQREDDIRLKGTRIGIETILYDYIHRRRHPEEIAATYPSLNLEQVYATLTYYLHNKEKIDAYMTDWFEHGRRMREEQMRNPSPARLRIQKEKARRQAERAAQGTDSSSR